ncbi:hypothetical protein NP493_14g06073 [Ridgeia piscesae]|uniref:Galaxin-like repeats domain-containing protein n=1 Tax=Ridgeia piscesae TaxID=27915 RepID=A0AAD9PER1_RIDPI|nr:hypothetical protein NP493_14g06073 [Ridgeia piscesae]
MNTSTKRMIIFVTIVACCVHQSWSWFDKDSDCDGQSYDSRVETCCENILWAGATPYDECCGVQVYDSRKNTSTKRMIIFVTIVACCVNQSWSWFDKDSDCDGQSYDSRVETCCENILWAGATPYDECCGVQVFDSRKYMCCDGELYSKRERKEC